MAARAIVKFVSCYTPKETIREFFIYLFSKTCMNYMFLVTYRHDFCIDKKEKE